VEKITHNQDDEDDLFLDIHFLRDRNSPFWSGWTC